VEQPAISKIHFVLKTSTSHEHVKRRSSARAISDILVVLNSINANHLFDATISLSHHHPSASTTAFC
jgi:hypothetical protein